jgi:hypothetical protein
VAKGHLEANQGGARSRPRLAALGVSGTGISWTTELALWENRTTLRVKGEFALTAIDNDLLSGPSLFVELTAAESIS